ncbi:Peptidyl-prolyl cis-trans isomerase CWC27 like protein [Eufriesea mexicana]|nr:Peptidyl-prolyl cis-trans isomerase CWC27 like protein [Eufriesea mexicana]
MENEKILQTNVGSIVVSMQVCLHHEKNNYQRIHKAQGGDSTGTGEGGKIYGAPFKKDDNGSQYFFILSSTPDLQNKHTISGRATGESIYSMLKLEEALVNENDRPLYPPRLIKTIILNNPFSDIIPRIIVQTPRIIVQEKFSPDSIVLCNEKFCYRDLNLLSFDGEAKEDEEESVKLNKEISGKNISAHDHLTDPKLSSQ